MRIVKVPSLKTGPDVEQALARQGFDVRTSENLAILGRPYDGWYRPIGNRFCILPMEGWDAEPDGRPSALLERRWLNFARGGAKLLWGCEAAAVEHPGKANPRQLVIDENTVDDIAALYRRLRQTHAEHCGGDDDLVVGLQLTHSGRWCRPNGVLEPKILYRDAELDQRVNAGDGNLLHDDDIERLVSLFVDRAVLAEQAGFDFVDIKHCHGYLAHEFLSATRRSGKFGGSLVNRTRFLREIVMGIRKRAPNLPLGVRLSAYDLVPYRAGDDGVGKPVTAGDMSKRFGADASGIAVDLDEPRELLRMFVDLGVNLVCITAGSPYYNPHIQRPARYPPSDGYLPPEDPLAGVGRMITATRDLKQSFPNLTFVGSGYTYLQEWIAQVGAGEVERNGTDFLGLGRMALSYPDLPRDVLGGRPLARKKLCRTFSDCTTAPRQGLVSGCYPLDDFYAKRPEADELKAFKRADK